MSGGGGVSAAGTASRSPSAGPVTTTTVAITYRNGDVLLRAGEEAWIQEITGGLYSHAGICVDPPSKRAADAHPVDPHRTAGHEVAEVPIADFFSLAHAQGGGDVFRYTGPKVKAEAAATWAKGECGKPYTFDIMDPILGSAGTLVENNRLYCSEFVWRAYKKGAGVELVKTKDFINLLSKANTDRTVRVLTPMVREQESVSKVVPDAIVRKRLRKELIKRHNGHFISPSQLADSPLTKKVHRIRGGAKKASSSKKS